MPDNVLQDTLTVTSNGQTYEFAIPSYLDEIKIGVKSRDLIRAATGDFGASMDGLDNQTHWMITTAARFEVLLRRSSTEWPWSAGVGGKPVVDFQKWPKDKVVEALAIGALFAVELGTFRSGGTTDTDTTGPQAMAGQPDITPEPIRSGPIAA
jgi:hypothetical protein